MGRRRPLRVSGVPQAISSHLPWGAKGTTGIRKLGDDGKDQDEEEDGASIKLIAPIEWLDT